MLSNNHRDKSQISPLFLLISCAIQKEMLTLRHIRLVISLRISNITNLIITTIMSLAHIALSLYAAGALAQTQPVDGKFQLLTLPYATSALEPVIGAQTVEIHHGKHLNTYVTNLNNLLPGSGFEGKTLE